MDHPLPDAAAFRDAETGLVMALPKGRILKELTPLLASPDGVSVLHAAVEIANPEQRTDSARRAMSRW